MFDMATSSYESQTFGHSLVAFSFFSSLSLLVLVVSTIWGFTNLKYPKLQQAPTNKPTTKKKANSKTPEKVVILKAKKSAKRIRITLKKAENVSGYQVAVYKSKKNAKKNKKAIVKKHIITTSTKLKSKKFKKKILYVRARAYRVYTGKVYYGAWSDIKKVK